MYENREPLILGGSGARIDVTVREKGTRTKGVTVRTVGRIERSQRRASWATRRTPSRVLADHFGVSPSGARHMRSGRLGSPLQVVLGMIADPGVDAAPIVSAVLAAYEERFLAGAPAREALARLLHLREVEEHRAEAEQNRATVILCPQRTEAYLYHAGVLTEMSVLEEVLGQVGA